MKSHHILGAVLAPVCALALVLVPAMASADVVVHYQTEGVIDEGDFGLGLTLGDPIGVTGKVYLTDDHALQAVVGVRPTYGRFFGYGSPHVGPFLAGDWTYELVDFGPDNHVAMFSPYLGVGAQVGWYQNGCYRTVFGYEQCSSGLDTALGVRVPVGFSAKFSPVTIEAFVEVTPVFGLLPRPLYAELAASTGGRFYF